MGWICHECSSYNEDDTNRECWVCGALRSKIQIRKDKYKKIKERVETVFSSFNRFMVVFSFSILVLAGFVMALFLILSIINNELGNGFIGLFNVIKTKFTPLGEFFRQLDIPFVSNIRNIFSHFGLMFGKIADYLYGVFHANAALNAIGPYFREFGTRFSSHFHAFIDFFKGLKWSVFSSIIDYIKNVIERIKSHFSSSKEVELINALIALRKLIIIGG